MKRISLEEAMMYELQSMPMWLGYIATPNWIRSLLAWYYISKTKRKYKRYIWYRKNAGKFEAKG